MFVISTNVQIPMTELQFSFARSGGPGGQNVNKVNSKAILRWSVANTSTLPPTIRTRFYNKYGERLTTEGDLVISSQKYRDQSKNIEDCLEKLREMIVAILSAPKKRRPTKPTYASEIRRTEKKSKHSQKKQQRRSPRIDD